MYKIGIIFFLCLFAIIIVWDEKSKEHYENKKQQIKVHSIFNEITGIFMLLMEMLYPVFFLWFLWENNFNYMLYTLLFSIWTGQINLKRYIEKKFDNEKTSQLNINDNVK